MDKNVTRITDYLWISDLIKDEEFKERVPEEVDKVVNLSGYNGTKADLWYPLIDGENDQLRFDGAVHNVLELVKEGNTVLVHCAMGVSRSVGVGIAVVQEVETVPYDKAEKLVLEKRSQGNPNSNIIRHIRDLDQGHARLDWSDF